MKVGIIAGRFQTHQLHEAHIGLIQTAIDQNDRVIIFVGGHRDVKNTPRNPLPYELRAEMIHDHFKNEPVEIHDISDVPCRR